MWERLAGRYGNYPDFIAFDLLNEIVDVTVTDIWNRLASEAVGRIRKYTKDTWILIGGTCYNSVTTVKDIIMPPDERIVYSVHFYEPHIFTHQEPAGKNLCQKISGQLIRCQQENILNSQIWY